MGVTTACAASGVVRRNGRAAKGDGVVVKATKFGRFSNLGVNPVVQAHEREEGEEARHDYLGPVSGQTNKQTNKG